MFGGDYDVNGLDGDFVAEAFSLAVLNGISIASPRSALYSANDNALTDDARDEDIGPDTMLQTLFGDRNVRVGSLAMQLFSKVLVPACIIFIFAKVGTRTICTSS